jgi:hypothetical protein
MLVSVPALQLRLERQGEKGEVLDKEREKGRQDLVYNSGFISGPSERNPRCGEYHHDRVYANYAGTNDLSVFSCGGRELHPLPAVLFPPPIRLLD